MVNFFLDPSFVMRGQLVGSFAYGLVISSIHGMLVSGVGSLQLIKAGGQYVGVASHQGVDGFLLGGCEIFSKVVGVLVIRGILMNNFHLLAEVLSDSVDPSRSKALLSSSSGGQ